ncbi:ABC transporter ATP-binding protein [Fibrella forsythiae]|uniref:ABC transporter ATP-binding protein n=1 Tax=Fibrella forsythiae TaxID=2817061 RepID=A0ABS3JAV6_9BACT|nr:ABC transporter ATP-binding protein [Fibrella forsythiae]MBO0947122.1 ABC transporter ATP-binding protein [Fibrella forsythiae]
MLTATHLSKSFADLAAIRNVSLTLAAGQIMALVGASGSGKSTLLNIIAGLLDADRGEVRLDGGLVIGPKDVLVAGHPQIRVVPQEYQLMPNISIRENINYALRFYERTYRSARVDELLKLCRLEAVQHHKPREASGGEKQRTAIARAVAEPARVLLLDEPFSHLDLPNRLIIRDLLFELVRQQIGDQPPPACLFVTHDATDALSIADQIGIIQQGQLKQIGTPREVYFSPKTTYAARMTGPVNVFRGKHLSVLGLPPTHPSEAFIGLRPEHISLADDGPVAGTVQAVFFQGRQSELDVRVSRYVSVRLLTERDDVQVGDQVRIHLNGNRLMSIG